MRCFNIILLFTVLGLATQVSGFGSWGHEDIIHDLYETFDKTQQVSFQDQFSSIKLGKRFPGGKDSHDKKDDDDDDDKCDPHILEYFKNCSIWSDVTTGLKLKAYNPFEYFKKRIDPDLCPRNNTVDIKKLWRIFEKTMEKAGLKIEAGPGVIGSCELIGAKVLVKSKRSFFPVKGALVTGYVVPKFTHSKLRASFKTADAAALEYNVEDIASIDLLLDFPFTRAKYAIQVSLQQLVPSQNGTGLSAPFETKEVGKVKIVKLVRAPPHKAPPKPCPPKPAPGPEPESDGVLLDSDASESKYIDNVLSKQDQAKIRNKIEELHHKQDETLGGEFDDEIDGDIIEKREKDLKHPPPPPRSFLGRYFDWIMGLFGFRKPEEMEPQMDNMFGHPCLGKKHHKHRKHHKHDDDDDKHHHHHHKEPERGPLGFVKTKGFVFGEGVGFGFSQSEGAFIKADEGEYLSISSGYDQYGFCYDP